MCGRKGLPGDRTRRCRQGTGRAGRDADEDALLAARAAAEEASDAVAAEERAQAQRAQWEREDAERAEQ